LLGVFGLLFNVAISFCFVEFAVFSRIEIVSFSLVSNFNTEIMLYMLSLQGPVHEKRYKSIFQ
jgi:hypothetical protein